MERLVAPRGRDATWLATGDRTNDEEGLRGHHDRLKDLLAHYKAAADSVAAQAMLKGNDNADEIAEMYRPTTTSKGFDTDARLSHGLPNSDG